MFKRKAELFIGQTYREFTHVNRFRWALTNPREAQERKLLSIIQANVDSEFGKKHHFDKINSIADFQSYVPQTSYDSLAPYIEQMLNGKNGLLTSEPAIMFATTSGTTGKPKYIPITESHLKDYGHAFQIHNYKILDDVPEAANGKILIFSSNDEDGLTDGGTPHGAVSGLLRRRQSLLVRKFFALPQCVGKIKDVESKYYTMLRLALAQDVTSILGCNPSSFLLFADQLLEHAPDLISDIFDGSMRKQYAPIPAITSELGALLKPDRKRALELETILKRDGQLTPKAVWPNLAFLSCWKGGPLSFYLDRIPLQYGPLPLRDFGYMASEGRGTIPLSNEGAGGVLAVSCHFFEFVAENDMDSVSPKFLTAEQLEVGGRYFIHFTTAAGLYRYNIHDLMEVVGFEQDTPIIQFVQKGLGISSVTGEKLTEEQVQVALRTAVAELNMTALNHFTFAVQMDYPPRYVCFAELKWDISESLGQEFLRVFEESLQLQNIEYKDKRMSRRLGAPTLQIMPPGSFTKLRQQRVAQGAPEAQVKIPLLNPSQAFSDILTNLVKAEK